MTRQQTPDIMGEILAAKPGPKTVFLKVADIRRDGGMQPRASVDADYVQELVAALQEGATLPAIDVTFDGSDYWLWDGYHRWQAHYELGLLDIAVNIHQGDQASAQWESFGTNQTHGLRRTNDDKERATRAALRHPKATALSNREISRHLGVDEKTIRKYREQMTATAEIPQSTERMGGDGRTINTANIGASRATPVFYGEMCGIVRNWLETVWLANGGAIPENPAHTNGTLWRDLTAWLHANIARPWKEVDLKEAIKTECRREMPQPPTRLDDLPVVASTGPVPFVPKIVPPDPDVLRQQLQAERTGQALEEFSATVSICPNCRQGAGLTIGRATGSDLAHRVEAACPQCGGAWAWIWSPANPLTGRPAVRLTPPSMPHIEPSVTTLADVTPVSQRDDYDSDEWYTPTEYIEAARSVMGSIELDPASSDLAQTVVQATSHLTKADNGLAMTRWLGQTVWLNPPYSSPAPWVEKLIAEHQRGTFVTQAIILVNNATETAWFQSLLERYPVCLPSKRIAFWRHDQSGLTARQGQAFFYLGPNVAEFTAIFSQFGPVLRRFVP